MSSQASSEFVRDHLAEAGLSAWYFTVRTQQTLKITDAGVRLVRTMVTRADDGGLPERLAVRVARVLADLPGCTSAEVGDGGVVVVLWPGLP